jgi:hypothetical protein
MAITETNLPGNGTAGPFTYTFPALEAGDIYVSVDGVVKTVTTDYSLNFVDKQITFLTTPYPTVSNVIRIYRVTDDADLAATFYSGAAIRATDLNTNFTQGLYVTQESNREAATAISTAGSAVTTANAATATANSAVSTANAATATANTALSNSSAAVSTANTASSNASAAVSTANTASSNASAAVSTANTASSNATAAVNTANAATATANSAASDAATAISTANGAVTTANSAAADAATAISTANTASSNASAAVSTANTASSNATSAVNTANSALSTANAAASAVANAILYDIVANVAAIPASPANNDAVEVTDSTGIESFTPLTSIPGGFAGNSGLSVRIVYTTTGNTWTWIQYFPNDPETRYLKEAVTTSDTAPVSPSDGDLWYDSVGGRTYVYYDDGAGSQWVDTSPQGSGVSDAISEGDTSAEVIDTGSDGRFVVTTEGSERLRVDPSGRLLVGTATSRDSNCSLQIVNDSTATFECFSGRNDNYGPGVIFAKSRGTTSSPTVVSSGDELGGLRFRGYDGTDYRNGAEIKAEVDGTPGAYDMPSRIVLSTTADGTSSPTERLRITSAGLVGMGTSAPDVELHIHSTSDNAALEITRGAVGSEYGYALYGSAGATDAALRFFTVENGLGTGEKMRLDASGRLGIGTSSPAHYLHVSASVNDAVTNIVNTDTTNGYGLSVVAGGSASNRYIARFADAGNNAKAIILANGNVGIGTTAPTTPLSVRAVSNIPTYGNVSANFSDNTTGTLYISHSGAVQGLISDGALAFGSGASGTERARIDSSGRLLVGTSSAVGVYGLQIEQAAGSPPFAGSILLRRGLTTAEINATGYTLGAISAGSQTDIGGSILFESDAAWGSGDYPTRLMFSTTADGASSPTERLRIDSRGQSQFTCSTGGINIANFSSSGASGQQYGIGIVTTNDQNDATRTFVECYGAATLRAAFRSNGGLANYSANNANLSDRNAKKDISPAAGTWDCIKDWEIVNYRYKDQSDDADLNLGVIAQQVAESCPEVITVFEEAKDDQPEKLGVKEQQMYWMAIKALQEAQVRIETLEAANTDLAARLTALEGGTN